MALALMILAPLAAMLIQMAVSRSREYGADESGARLVGHPEGLARALGKLKDASERVPMRSGRPRHRAHVHREPALRALPRPPVQHPPAARGPHRAPHGAPKAAELGRGKPPGRSRAHLGRRAALPRRARARRRWWSTPTGAAGPSPVQALALALAGCMSVDVVHILERGRQPLRALRARLVAERAAEDPHRLVRVDLRFTVTRRRRRRTRSSAPSPSPARSTARSGIRCARTSSSRRRSRWSAPDSRAGNGARTGRTRPTWRPC